MAGGVGLAARLQAVRRELLRRLGLGGVLWGVVLLELALLAGWLLTGDGGWSQGSRVPFVLDLLVLLAWGGLGLLLARWARRDLSLSRVTRDVETTAGLPRGAVQGPLELEETAPPGVSRSLSLLGTEQVMRELVPGEAVGLAAGLGGKVAKLRTWGLRAVLVGGGVLLLLAVTDPQRSLRSWGGLLVPARVAAQPVLPPLAVDPGPANVLRGGELEVIVDAPGRGSVMLEWLEIGGVPSALSLPSVGGRAVHRFSRVEVPFEYSLTAPDGAAAGPFAVTIRDALVLTSLALRIRYPPHTGLAEAEVVGDPPLLSLPRGTTLRVQAQASRPLGRAEIVRRDGPGEGGIPAEDSAVATLAVDGFEARGEWRPGASGRYGWALEDLDGRRPEEALPGLEIEILEDAGPEVAFLLPARDTALPVSREQPLILQARDDYGVAALEVEAERITSLGRRGERVTQRFSGGDARDVLFRPVLDVSSWGLLPGDTVRVRARVLDNNPQTGTSEVLELNLWLPREDGLREEAVEQMEAAADLLEEMEREAGEVAERSRDMERGTQSREGEQQTGDPRAEGGDESLGFEEQEDLRQALSQEADLLQRADSLGQAMGDLSEDLAESGLPDPELQAQLEELQALMETLASPETLDQLQAVAEELAGMDREEAVEAMEDMAARQEQLREQIERALERFQAAAAEQEFRSATEEAEELAMEEEILADALGESETPGELEPARQELEARTEELADRMASLEETMNRMGEEAAAQRMEEAGESTRSAAEAMKRAGEELSSGRQRQASGSTREASQELSEAADQLRRAQQEMARQQQEALLEAMTQVTSDALALARRQAALQEEMRSRSPAELPGLRGEQAAVMEGLRNMAEEVAEATRDAPGLGEPVNQTVGQAMRRVQATAEALERGGRGPGPSPHASAESAVEGLNRVALQAMASARALNQPGSGGSSQDVMEQLQQLAQQQGDLMNRSETVVPMDMSQPGRQSQAQQIGEGQESVAGELGELAREQGESGEILGDLQAMAEAAEALARELQSGRLDATTVQRQEELFRRLLDAGLSLQRDEYSEERTSESPGAVLREPAGPLDLDALGGRSLPFPGREELSDLTPVQRLWILEYFQRLNRQRSGGTEQ